ncbi:hypothetical protein GGX14DRAFT_566434 [Mycena pura]|uniref:Uncharacterized protein n=1 Tax=Mycena pura TaxID=153505 RepID=A0AAD6VCX8_9AGAR|nr:hypothetical protein GGX14DRAFT_566434 [Mycena pura]
MEDDAQPHGTRPHGTRPSLYSPTIVQARCAVPSSRQPCPIGVAEPVAVGFLELPFDAGFVFLTWVFLTWLVAMPRPVQETGRDAGNGNDLLPSAQGSSRCSLRLPTRVCFLSTRVVDHFPQLTTSRFSASPGPFRRSHRLVWVLGVLETIVVNLPLDLIRGYQLGIRRLKVLSHASPADLFRARRLPPTAGESAAQNQDSRLKERSPPLQPAIRFAFAIVIASADLT